MPVVTNTVLKSYFNNGDVPNESNYNDLIDSLGSTNWLSMYSLLPGLRAFWPGGAIDENGVVQDVSGQGRHLSTYNLGSSFHYGFMTGRRVIYTSSQFSGRASELGLSYNSLGWQSTVRGLTVGSWVRFSEDSGISQAIAGKYDGSGGNREYLLIREYGLGGALRFYATQLGVTAETVNTVGVLPIDSSWQFVVGRYKTVDQTIMVMQNDEIVSKTTSIAGLFKGTAPFALGAYFSTGVPTSFLSGAFSMSFLCGSAVPDSILLALYNGTRVLFGV